MAMLPVTEWFVLVTAVIGFLSALLSFLERWVSKKTLSLQENSYYSLIFRFSERIKNEPLVGSVSI